MLSLISLLSISIANAQSRDEQPIIIYKDVLEIDFRDFDVTANINTPSNVVIDIPNRPMFNPLIKLRRDFNSELSYSVTNIK